MTAINIPFFIKSLFFISSLPYREIKKNLKAEFQEISSPIGVGILPFEDPSFLRWKKEKIKNWVALG
jgi:hypothetical protein